MEFVKSISSPFHYKYLLMFLDIALWNVVAVFMVTFLFMSICSNSVKSITYFLFILSDVFNNWIQGLRVHFLNFLLDFLAVFVISNTLSPDSYFSGYPLVI